MQVKKYHASSMHEALKQVRKDLGSQAVILSTKTVDGIRGRGRAGSQRGVEVVAAIDYEVNATAPETKPFSQLVKKGISPRKDLLSEKDSLENIQRELEELKEMMKQSTGLFEGSKSEATHMELKELRWMTRFLLTQAAPLNHYHFPEHLVYFYCQMLRQGICEEIVLKLIKELNQDLSPDALGNKDRVRDSLVSKIGKELLLAGPVDLVPGRPKVVALVGPTGVGKTTTAAKLAADCALDKKWKVALVTIDVYRIAAAEQLKVYAKIMGLPFKAVSSPKELSKALIQFADRDLIIVDTAGRSQRDRLQIKELKSFLTQSFPVEICLVMSITHKEDTLSATGHQFELLPIENIIFTKLDETYTYGSIVNQLYRTKKPLSYLTTGQKVPEDIEVASKERIIPLILGESDPYYC